VLQCGSHHQSPIHTSVRPWGNPRSRDARGRYTKLAQRLWIAPVNRLDSTHAQ
jgi:hypothetical protein